MLSIKASHCELSAWCAEALLLVVLWEKAAGTFGRMLPAIHAFLVSRRFILEQWSFKANSVQFRFSNDSGMVCHKLRGIGVHHQSGNLNHKARCGGKHDIIGLSWCHRCWKLAIITLVTWARCNLKHKGIFEWPELGGVKSTQECVNSTPKWVTFTQDMEILHKCGKSAKEVWETYTKGGKFTQMGVDFPQLRLWFATSRIVYIGGLLALILHFPFMYFSSLYKQHWYIFTTRHYQP